MKKITLLLLLFGVYFNSYSQTDTVNINNTFYTSQTIYTFAPAQTIYGFRINGSISFVDYTSLTRVILVKNDSTELLIYEAYPWLNYNVSGKFSFSNAGDETYYLDAMDVSYIKVEIFNAKIDITTMLIDTVYNSNIPTWRTQYIDSLRLNKIDSVNNNIQAHNLLWLAGDNEVVQMSYNNKKIIFSNDSISSFPFNTFGLEYYKGGIYSIIGYTYPSGTRSNIVESFDWRNRHSQNWITSVKNQLPSGFCWAFAPIASLEAIINLYYNKHLDKNLSEKAFVSCRYGIYRSFVVDSMPTPPLQQQCGAIPMQSMINCNFKALGAMDESCYPFTAIDDSYGLDPNNGSPCTIEPPNNCVICGASCVVSGNYLQQLWKIDDFKELDPPYYYNPANCSYCELINDSSLKVNIILNGPQNCMWNPEGHDMCFVGFGIINEGDTIYGNTYPNLNPFYCSS